MNKTNIHTHDCLNDITCIHHVTRDRLHVHGPKVITFIGTNNQINEYTEKYPGINKLYNIVTKNSGSNLFFINIIVLRGTNTIEYKFKSLNDVLVKERLFHIPFYNKHKNAKRGTIVDISKDNNNLSVYDGSVNVTLNLPGTYFVVEEYILTRSDIEYIEKNDYNDPGSLHVFDQCFNGSVYKCHEQTVIDINEQS